MYVLYIERVEERKRNIDEQKKKDEKESEVIFSSQF